MMPFLYFPENKWEYLPAGLTCLLFIIGAFLTWRIFVKASQREAKRLEHVEKQIQELNGTGHVDLSAR
ncbi:hypothetical protein [Ectobacillus ponti]|uniref:Uncharacterized protein n=1 Tax=Ectobacillus ponti TaxID=2961894 RepID=A0AA41XBA8_9BACI|nr:hypothetical protein [Ectobacillus ponti]MCP8969810.1 hypothetical protein [Ectobacillus ponti]